MAMIAENCWDCVAMLNEEDRKSLQQILANPVNSRLITHLAMFESHGLPTEHREIREIVGNKISAKELERKLTKLQLEGIIWSRQGYVFNEDEVGKRYTTFYKLDQTYQNNIRRYLTAISFAFTTGLGKLSSEGLTAAWLVGQYHNVAPQLPRDIEVLFKSKVAYAPVDFLHNILLNSREGRDGRWQEWAAFNDKFSPARWAHPFQKIGKVLAKYTTSDHDLLGTYLFDKKRVHESDYPFVEGILKKTKPKP